MTMAKRKRSSVKDSCHVKVSARPQSTDKKKKMMKTKPNTKINVSRSSVGKATDLVNERRRSLRSTPLAAYDFIGDSPNQRAKASSNDKKSNSKKASKVRSTKSLSSKSKATKCEKAKVEAAVVTPKTRMCKVVPHVSPASLEGKRKKDKRVLKPIQQPNLDDISPIVKDTAVDKKDAKKVQRRSQRSAEKAKSAVDSPSLSFIVPRSNLDCSNDSAIFVSPRRTMPRFTSGKTSTPADIPRQVKKTTKTVLKAKNTSTPIEVKPKKQYTSLKSKKSVSPVQRTETPTSDYCSMELFETPDLSPWKPVKTKKRSHSPNPVFSMEEQNDSMALNKTLDRSYKQRTKRKYESSKKADSRIEEWIEKVNSELEDIENFELSVEG